MAAAAAELERALKLPGVIGAQLPGNLFLTRKDAEAAKPLLEVADREEAVLFIHHDTRRGLGGFQTLETRANRSCTAVAGTSAMRLLFPLARTED